MNSYESNNSTTTNAPLSTEQLFGAEPFRRTLPNGLEVYFSPEHSAGLLSAQVWVKTGSVHETPLLGSGISHFIEHMVFKGTEKFACREISERLQAAGADINAYTSFNRTVYYIDGPKECADLALKILSQLVFHATFNAEETERERDVILREIDMRDDDPSALFSEAVLAEVFHECPYRLPVIGLRDVFKKITRQQLVDYYRARYVPNNMVLVLAGALSPEEVFSLSEKYFAAKPAGALTAPCVPTEPRQLARRRGTIYADTQVLRGAMVWRIPGLRHADAAALDIFTSILGCGESSRLNRRLRDELQIVHDVNASNWTPSDVGLLWLSYTADPGRRDAVESEVLAVVENALAGAFNEREFQKARRGCLMAFLNARKTVTGIAGQLGVQAVVINDPEYRRLYLERISTLTPAEVLEAARRHIRTETLTCHAMEPRAAERERTVADARERAFGPVLFEEVVLANGLRVLLQPVHSFPKVNIRLALPAGGRCEPADKRGIAALLTTLMTRDTETHSAAEVAEAIEILGTSLHDSAGNNSLSLSLEVLQQDVETAINILGDAVIRPALSEKTFLIERDCQRAAIEETEDDVVEFGKMRLRQLFFGENPLCVDAFGRKDDLAAMTPADVRALYSRLVQPKNAVLAISGDFGRDAVLDVVKKRFSHWSTTGTCVVPDLHSPAAGSPVPATKGRITEKRHGAQAVVFLALPDCGVADDAYVTGQLVTELLNGMASQLFNVIREERGLAYFVGANRVNALRDGMFYFCAGTAPENVEEVLDAIHSELERLRDGRTKPEEITSAKARLRTARRLGLQTIGMRTLNASLNALYGLEINRNEWWEAVLDAQNRHTLKRYFSTYLRSENALTYVILPENS